MSELKKYTPAQQKLITEAAVYALVSVKAREEAFRRLDAAGVKFTQPGIESDPFGDAMREILNRVRPD